VTTLERLQSEPVLDTVRRLESRIAARFPDRGLRRVASELERLTAEVQRIAPDLRGRVRTARAVGRALAVLVLAGIGVAVTVGLRSAAKDTDREFDWLFVVETTINDVVFAAIAVYFLITFPDRVQRGHTLALLHRLRSLAHIVDMHQLTKDPERLRASFEPTRASVDPQLNREQMEHYLNYCSELLSLVAKAAALCAEESRDSVVLDTVSRIEELTAGMSREIWQKISVLPSA
jgi:hypothetical protein